MPVCCMRSAKQSANVPCPFFSDLADSIIDYARWERAAGTVDKWPVFPNHATALRKGGIFRLRREFSLYELLKISLPQSNLAQKPGLPGRRRFRALHPAS